jgi:hypothetical protein
MALGAGGYSDLYLIGSEGKDRVTVTTSGSAPFETVKFQLAAGTVFDESTSAEAGCTVPTPGEAVCNLTTPLDSVLVAGLEEDDILEAPALPATTSLMLLGGNNADQLLGGEASDDTLVDGPGNDLLRGLGGDDMLLNNQGADSLLGEAGNDLFLSTALCETDAINGGPGRDNASWAKLKEGVEARLDQGRAGHPGPGGEPVCAGGAFDTLFEIEDLEGSASPDTFYGDAGENQLLGHLGADTYLSEGGKDSILANAGDNDAAINCGEGVEDTALIDRRPKYNDPTPIECETVREADPNNYRTVTELPAAVIQPPPLPPPDRKLPRTKITKRPAKLLLTTRRHRRVVFRFSSNERGSSFRCKLDGKPYRTCVSPRIYNLSLGRHAVRIVAVDAAGNADRTPALFRFQIRQLRRR